MPSPPKKNPPTLSLDTHFLGNIKASVPHCEVGKKFRQYLDDSLEVSGEARCQWLTPVILAIWETDIQRIAI
jgi:hypothetical protein